VSRTSLIICLGALLAAPLAQAAPTATTAAPTVQTQSPGSAFGPLVNGVDTGAQSTSTQPAVTQTTRAGDTGSGRGTLLLLSAVALVMIAGVGAFIYYEGRKTARGKRRRQRMRSARTPQPAAAGSGARRGPPPPPRKRRAQAAKRRKR
jgi:uncharacterized protein HemX